MRISAVGDAGRVSVSLRPVAVGDACFLQELMNRPAVRDALCEEPTNVSHWREAILAWREDDDEQNFVIEVLINDSALAAGWIGVNGLSSADGVVWVKMLGLLPPYWGQGIASQALRAVMTWAAGQHKTRVKLWTDLCNARARRCYERNGLREERRALAEVGSLRVTRWRLVMAALL